MRARRLQPLAWGLGLGLGAGAAIALGAHAPTWGAVLASPATVLILSIGAWKERDDAKQEITQLLRFVLGFTIGFLALNVPLTWMELDDMIGGVIGGAGPEPELLRDVARMRAALVPRWLVAALALPGGVTALWLRRGIAKKADARRGG